MIDHTLSAINQRYKTGTNHVEAWLSKAVRQRYDLLGIECSLDAKPTRNPSIDLIKLAQELLTGCRPTLSPPKDVDMIIRLIKDVDTGRREAAKWHQHSAKDQKDLREDYAHNKFREVLCDVLGTLQQIRPASMSTIKRVRNPKSCRSTGSSSEDFASSPSVPPLQTLDLRIKAPESARGPLASEPRRSGSGSIIKKHRIAADESAVKAKNYDPDAEGALVCFLGECYEIRQTLRRIWRDLHNDNKTGDFATASLVTNCGIAMIVELAMQFSAEYPDLATFDDVDLDTNAWWTRSWRIDSKHSFSVPGQWDDRSADPGVRGSELVYTPALDLLKRLRRLLHDNDHHLLAQIDKGHLLGGDIMTSRLELKQLRNNAGKRQKDFAGCDVFTQLITAFAGQPQHLPFATIMTTQIWMDIYDCMGRDFETRRSAEFRSSMEAVFHTMSSLIDHEKQVALRNKRCPVGLIPSDLNPKILQIVKQGIETPISKDIEVALPSHLSKRMAPRLLAKLPGLSGYTSGIVCGLSHAANIHVCNQGLLVHSIAHLYRAAKLVNPDFFWDDLEFLLFHQQQDTFGLQTSPVAADVANYFGRSFGIKARHQKTGKRQPLPPYETCLAQAKKLQGSNAYLSQCETNASSNLSQPEKLAQSCREFAACETDSSSKISASGILELLNEDLKDDKVHLHFDHRAFFMDCLHLVDLTTKSLTPDFLAKLPKDFMFHHIVDELLWEWKASLSSNTPPTFFHKTLEVLEDHTSRAKHLTAAERIAGRSDEAYRRTRPGAAEAKIREEARAEEERMREEKDKALRARVKREREERWAKEKKEAKMTKAGGECSCYCCSGCGEWVSG